MSYDLSDYVDVKKRLELFYREFPTGSIQFEFKGICDWNPDMIWGIAYAYRTPDDPRPAIGTAQELAQGRTSFTRGSELMNLETSAWGRAIGALGIGLEAGIATKQEVKYAKERVEAIQADNEARKTGGVTPKQANLINALFNKNYEERDRYLAEWKEQNGIPAENKLSSTQASKLIEQLKAEGRVAVYSSKEKDPWDLEIINE